MRKTLLSAMVATALAIPAVASANVTDAMIQNDAKSTGDVLSWGIGTEGQRYSPLKDINVSNVGKLVPAWSFSFGGEKQRGQESQPLIHNGKMFVTGSYSRIYALDASTGEKLWKYEHRLPEGIMPCCDVVNRGAALYDNLVIFSTLDAQLIALDQNTGKVVWKDKIDDYAAGYSNTAAPIIANGLVLTGVSGGEFGVVGRVEARNAKTGEMVWLRPTVEGHMGYTWDKDGNKKEAGISGTTNATWKGDMWKTGGAATWLGGSYDSKTGLAYFGTGNPAPWNSHLRPGDNLYSTSTVAVDVKTGQIKWHYQSTPNDGWDYDGVNEFVTFDMNGKRVGAKADRNGFMYVNDATTGKLENAFPFVKKITWAKGIDMKTGRPIFDPANRPGDPTKMDGKKGETVFSAPSFLGGKNQQPMAYSPDTGLFYVPANEWGMEIWNEPITYKKGAAYLGAGFTIKTLPGFDYIGALRAMNPKTGKIEWEITNNAPLWGGVLTTGGNLVFWGTPEGFLKAADAKTGKEVWKFQTGSGVVAPPVTWKGKDGQQYVAVVSGWGGAVPLWGGDVASKVNYLEQGGSVWVFKLMK
ncbi:MAG: PQQ-dependent methanol/ethanol family dehydrogenase [Limnobacter sp.]|jgi:alcohol dehydrogenase (cytochrome c)|uniref:PQQ-dependent methanol/ethanol family dehydrogenase n=1 Tax=unclassified Limnobacter TaxID=2630203 RepID=UPI000C358539|nr:MULTISPECIES: PQQ-dependent methanol/ethanol family dehydrogenase [unclassified Limnobacter]MAG82036.1 PQQ-dependent dehydrogenase, methanol/ethanol family [Sutterellaceae bacterium]PZO16308.1 MAG: PQQ-dependent dehydrogenase, methanol/ethanol family [Betaproteobacteria bacterium]MBT84793.1 PQQ-dependent dehydrogenase, methanol/ethanol family [Sutterellaceae bacterium]MDP3270845.1 PQQ-dependent methanol/ethanol family dehydrogenase [Limnobacter sp.]MDZ4051519.1 PQQ-dependent methanol/ethano|tara:strand:+ start:20658 stop:22403 length:1746 start_codon:yes stop_codon:yes gene_type:complete